MNAVSGNIDAALISSAVPIIQRHRWRGLHSGLGIFCLQTGFWGFGPELFRRLWQIVKWFPDRTARASIPSEACEASVLGAVADDKADPMEDPSCIGHWLPTGYYYCEARRGEPKRAPRLAGFCWHVGVGLFNLATCAPHRKVPDHDVQLSYGMLRSRRSSNSRQAELADQTCGCPITRTCCPKDSSNHWQEFGNCAWRNLFCQTFGSKSEWLASPKPMEVRGRSVLLRWHGELG